MPVDDELGDIVNPDNSWADRPPGPLTGAETPPPIGGEDLEQQAPASRRQRARILIAISLVVIAAAGIAYLYPSWMAKPKSQPLAAAAAPIASQTPLPVPSKTYVSDLMHYSVNYPADWAVTPATQLWHGEWGSWGQPDIDHLDGKYVAFWGTSQPLRPGQSATKWMNQYLATVASNKCGVQENLAVAGHAGVIDLNGCNSTELPGRIYDVVVVAGGRGYNFSMEGAVDHPFLLAMLATVKLP
jgi:hypothetical protein